MENSTNFNRLYNLSQDISLKHYVKVYGIFKNEINILLFRCCGKRIICFVCEIQDCSSAGFSDFWSSNQFIRIS